MAHTFVIDYNSLVELYHWQGCMCLFGDVSIGVDEEPNRYLVTLSEDLLAKRVEDLESNILQKCDDSNNTQEYH